MHREAPQLLPDTISILGSGWLGLPLARDLVNAGYPVRSSTTSPERSVDIEATGATPFIIDINYINIELREFIKCSILIINIPSRDVESFETLVSEIELSGVRHVIYVSSTSVYPNTNSAISESDGLEQSTSPFFIIENLFRSSRRFDTTVLRLAGLIGYSRHPGRFFSRGRVVPNPQGSVNLIHRDDCIGIIRQVIEQAAWGEVFNCCADTHPSRRDFYSRAAGLLGQAEPVFADNGPSAYKIISNQKVKTALNYEFQHPDLMQISF